MGVSAVSPLVSVPVWSFNSGYKLSTFSPPHPMPSQGRTVLSLCMTQISFYIQTEVNKGRAHLLVIHEEFWYQSILG